MVGVVHLHYYGSLLLGVPEDGERIMVGMKAFAFFAFCFMLGTLLSGIMEGQAAFAVTRLTADISVDGTTAEVTNTADFLDGPDDIYIGAELVRYTTKTDTQFNLSVRGLDDTEAVAHDGADLVEGKYVGGDKVKNESSNIINNLLGYNVATTAATYGTATAIVGLGWNLIKSIPKMIAWDYSYLEGQLIILRMALWTVSAGFVFSLGLMFIGAIQGLFRR